MKLKFTIAAALCLILSLCLKAQTFTKILTGPVVNDSSTSFGSSWIDFDQDDDLDLFVSNVYFENDRFYTNNGNGTFTQVTAGAIINDAKYSYNSTWGDYDNDGFEDVFIANGDWNGSNTNTMFHNNGNGTLTQIITGSVVTDIGVGIGSSWADYDNDGYIDLFVATILTSLIFYTIITATELLQKLQQVRLLQTLLHRLPESGETTITTIILICL